MNILADQYAMPMLDPNGGYTQYGLTIRQYYAGLAMQSLIVANPHSPDAKNASESVAMADALIEALNKED